MRARDQKGRPENPWLYRFKPLETPRASVLWPPLLITPREPRRLIEVNGRWRNVALFVCAGFKCPGWDDSCGEALAGMSSLEGGWLGRDGPRSPLAPGLHRLEGHGVELDFLDHRGKAIGSIERDVVAELELLDKARSGLEDLVR